MDLRGVRLLQAFFASVLKGSKIKCLDVHRLVSCLSTLNATGTKFMLIGWWPKLESHVSLLTVFLACYLLWQLIIDPFQLPEARHTKEFWSPGNSKPAWQLNVHTSPTTLPLSWRHELGETLVPGGSMRAEHVLATESDNAVLVIHPLTIRSYL